jgi:hypothetical protein
MAILNNSNAISTGGYDINNSLRFRASASASLSRTPSATNQKTWTWSGWVKRGAIADGGIFGAGTSGTNYFNIRFQSEVISVVSENPSLAIELRTTPVYRDPSAWYHIVLAVDTTQATAANRAKLYVNGVQVTAFTTATYPTLNLDMVVNSAVVHYNGRIANSAIYFDGYMAEVNFVDGQALTPSSFGETDTTTGSWKPKAYTGTYGTNGFYLKFSDIATTSGSNAGLGKDFSGNANYWTTNNISVTAGTTYDAMLDVPTNTSATVANYATWNPLERTAATYSEANLKVVSTSSAAPYNMTSTIQFPTTGKWYCEVEGIKGASNPAIGMGNNIPSDQFALYRTTGAYINGNISGIASSGTPATWTTGDIIGIAYDASAGTLSFYKNGTLQSGGFTSIPATGYFVAVRADSASGDGGYLNCGQRPFAYTPPTGFVRLNTFNLPDSTIKKGNTVMDATLWTGTGGARTITNAAGFRPDWVWVKRRSSADDHYSYDSVRGANLNLVPNSTVAEANVTTYGSGGIGAATSTGFTIVAGTTNADNLNGSGITYVGWQWQAGQGTTSSNTSGSITSTVSVNATAGFSVLTWTGNGSAGATIGHSLGVAPKWIIVKRRNSSGDDWLHYHTSLGATKSIAFDTAAAITSSTRWNNTEPSSTLITLGTSTGVNGSGATYVAYCWAEIAGFSKFGSYTGNGSADGPFVYLGFIPKYVMIKRTNTTGSWLILDSARETYNPEDYALYANLADTESFLSAGGLDFVSNGFKLRGTDSNINASGSTMIYAAFAENPFKNSNAR